MSNIYITKDTKTCMSEKKSESNTKYQCDVCQEVSDDFLELEDFSDDGFILCANCEAVSTSEDIYGADCGC